MGSGVGAASSSKHPVHAGTRLGRVQVVPEPVVVGLQIGDEACVLAIEPDVPVVKKW